MGRVYTTVLVATAVRDGSIFKLTSYFDLVNKSLAMPTFVSGLSMPTNIMKLLQSSGWRGKGDILLF